MKSHADASSDAGFQLSLDDLGQSLIDTTFCVLDVETTGTNPRQDLICEIGAVKVKGGETIGTFHTLVNPGMALPPQITVITGLTDAVLAPAPRIEQVISSLRQFIGDSAFVAHNASFDLGFVKAAFERSGIDDFQPIVVDTLSLSRRLFRDEVRNFKLGTLAERFGIENRPSHRALDDALATRDLLYLLIERAAGWGVTGLDDLVAIGKLSGHPQAKKLRLTESLPRSPGVYLMIDE
ncbi:MAG: exonuclease domain-containing protein, partial [Ilumatobacteraceae bacterium]